LPANEVVVLINEVRLRLIALSNYQNYSDIRKKLLPLPRKTIRFP